MRGLKLREVKQVNPIHTQPVGGRAMTEPGMVWCQSFCFNHCAFGNIFWWGPGTQVSGPKAIPGGWYVEPSLWVDLCRSIILGKCSCNCIYPCLSQFLRGFPWALQPRLLLESCHIRGGPSGNFCYFSMRIRAWLLWEWTNMSVFGCVTGIQYCD